MAFVPKESIDNQTEWQEKLSAHPEIGGENLDKALGDIKTVLDKLGATAETYAAFDYTGAGNHPDIVPILHKLVAHHLEPTLPDNPGSPPGGHMKTQGERMFGSK